MSRIYDNWERLVEATLDREKLRQIAFQDSSSESSFSFTSTRSDFSTGDSPLNTHFAVAIDNYLKGKVFQPVSDQWVTGLFPRQLITQERVDSFSSREKIPGVEDFQIFGHAKPGSKLLGCGYTVHGTSLCMFQWVRYYPDGAVEYIEGATNPEYEVTAEDVDKFIAVDCVPMNDRGEQGDLLRVFANEHRRITCGKEIQDRIDTYASKGMATFNVLTQTRYKSSSDNWEPATLIMTREGFHVKDERTQYDVLSERYSADTSITIPKQFSTEFVLTSSDGSLFPCRSPTNRLRDTIVLTMRMFENKGDLRVIANEHRSITRGKEIQDSMDTYASKGMATFNVLIQETYMYQDKLKFRDQSSSGNWEPATLIMKREGFHVKVERKRYDVLSERYSADMSITMSKQFSTEFVLKSSNGSSYPCRSSTNRMQNTIVLTMRVFQNKSLDERRKDKA